MYLNLVGLLEIDVNKFGFFFFFLQVNYSKRETGIERKILISSQIRNEKKKKKENFEKVLVSKIHRQN